MRPTVVSLCLILFSGPFSGTTTAQSFSDTSSADQHKKIKVLPVPAFGYSPETKTYIGAVALFTLDFYNDTLTRSSNAKVEFNYTWRKQIITELEWNYFFKAEKWFTQGLLHYSMYPDYYFGIGAGTLPEDQILFESNRIKMDVNALRNIGEKWFTGLGVRYMNYYNLVLSEEALKYEELKPISTAGIGLILQKDARNSLLTPTSGWYFRVTNNHNVARQYYSQLSLDLRKYFHWGKAIPQTVSTRAYSNHVMGDAPYYDMALLGGDKLVRGYFYGRFRDKNLSTLQAEYRATLFWRIGLAAFGGITAVYPDLKQLTDAFKPNAGAGLRFMVDKKERTNLRFDYAIGVDGASGFYVSFGESF